MDRMKIGIAMLCVALLSGCSHNQRALTKGQVSDVWSAQSSKEFVKVRGIGVAPQGTKGSTLKRGLARNAALVSARYELASLLKGVRLQGGLSVASLVEKDSKIKETMDQIISGAEEELTEFTADDGCVILVSISRAKIEKMLEDTASRESVAVAPRSLDDQIVASDARAAAQRAKLPGMAAQ